MATILHIIIICMMIAAPVVLTSDCYPRMKLTLRHAQQQIHTLIQFAFHLWELLSKVNNAIETYIYTSLHGHQYSLMNWTSFTNYVLHNLYSTKRYHISNASVWSILIALSLGFFFPAWQMRLSVPVYATHC